MKLQDKDLIGAHNPYRKRLRESAPERSRDYAWYEIKNRVGETGRDQVWGMVYGVLWRQIWNEVGDPIRFKIWDL